MSLTQEVWRDIAGTDGAYSVSSLGRVRSNSRTVISHNQHARFNRQCDGLILKEHHKGRYLRVGIRSRLRLVHRLVAAAFLPALPSPRPINHIDGDPENNRVSNLEWTTPLENQRHAAKLGLMARGERVKTAKLTAGKVRLARAMAASNMYSCRELAKIWGIDRKSLRALINRQTWRHVA